MSETTKNDGELLLFWLVPVLGLTWVATFLLFPGFLPPMLPGWSAEQVAAFYRDPHQLPLIRGSMIDVMLTLTQPVETGLGTQYATYLYLNRPVPPSSGAFGPGLLLVL